MKIKHLTTGITLGVLLFSTNLLSARGERGNFHEGEQFHENYHPQVQYNPNRTANSYVHGFERGNQYGEMQGGAAYYGGTYQTQTPQPSSPQQQVPDPANIPTTPYSEMSQVPFNPD